MDANETKFHLLLGRDDWSRSTTEAGLPVFESLTGLEPSFSWDDRRNELVLGSRFQLLKGGVPGHQPSLSDRRGAAQDRFGNWYWIGDSNTELIVNSSGTGAATHFWSSLDELSGCTDSVGGFQKLNPPIPETPLAFSGLAVTEQHYLVVGVVDPAGILVFDLYHGGPPRQFVWPKPVPFAPFDMAAAPGGGVWILDRLNRRLWALDRTFAVLRAGQPQQPIDPTGSGVFVPADGSPAPARPVRTFPDGLSLDASSPLSAFDPIAVEALPDGTVLILESNPASRFSKVHRFRRGLELGPAVSTDALLAVLAPADRPGFHLLGLDFAFIAGEQRDLLYFADSGGAQCWTFIVHYNADSFSLEPLAEYYPMRLYAGKGIVAGNGQVYYSLSDRWAPIVIQKRPRYAESESLITRVFDGKQPDCVWHRLMLDASIPSDASVQVWSRAHNDPEHLAILEWAPEPGPYPRGNGTELPWTNTGSLGTWELLFQRATGQYLQLKLTLGGNGRLTPRIRALRAYYPRFSYLNHYLPAVYREDAQSASFLDRFLSNIEGFFTSIEDRIATVQALLDVRSAPPEALDWLANWFGVALDPSWPDAKRRLFLNHAAQFFEARGTVPGLLMALRLTLEDCADDGIFTPQNQRVGVRVVEGFQNRSAPLGLIEGTTFQTKLWTPSLGAEDLHRRYRKAFSLAESAFYPVFVPQNSADFVKWRDFSRATLGLAPSVPGPGDALWPALLKNRYRTIAALNAAYGSAFARFEDVPFPAALPDRADALRDWFRFQGVLLMQTSAHQFTVFLPMAPGDAASVRAQRARLSLAQRVIELEKPAHTTYEVKFYWAFFRVGEARVGRDSVLDAGSRAPWLLAPVQLGDSFVGSGYLSRDPSIRGRKGDVL